MKQINEYLNVYDHWDHRRDLHKWLHWDYVAWMKAIFYLDIIEFLEYQNPKELMRETLRAKCEEIYENHKEIYDMLEISYYDLYNDKQLQEILEARNDLHINDDEDDNTD